MLNAFFRGFLSALAPAILPLFTGYICSRFRGEDVDKFYARRPFGMVMATSTPIVLACLSYMIATKCGLLELVFADAFLVLAFLVYAFIFH